MASDEPMGPEKPKNLPDPINYDRPARNIFDDDVKRKKKYIPPHTHMGVFQNPLLDVPEILGLSGLFDDSLTKRQKEEKRIREICEKAQLQDEFETWRQMYEDRDEYNLQPVQPGLTNERDQWWHPNREDTMKLGIQYLHRDDPRANVIYMNYNINPYRDYLMPEYKKKKVKYLGYVSNLDEIKPGENQNQIRAALLGMLSKGFATQNSINSIPDLFSDSINVGNLAKDFRASRHTEDMRVCHWKMHLFHTCLIAATNETNPFKIYPTYLSIFGIQAHSVYNKQCTDARLAVDAYCSKAEIDYFTRERCNEWMTWTAIQYKNKIKDFLWQNSIFRYMFDKIDQNSSFFETIRNIKWGEKDFGREGAVPHRERMDQNQMFRIKLQHERKKYEEEAEIIRNQQLKERAERLSKETK